MGFFELDRRDLEESRFSVGIFEDDTGATSTTSSSSCKEDKSSSITKQGAKKQGNYVKKVKAKEMLQRKNRKDPESKDVEAQYSQSLTPH